MKRRKKILVVDDEPDTVLTLKIILNTEFIVHAFTDPKIALRRFKAMYYDLVILDIKMPGINGFKLYSKLKSLDPHTKVLFLTALTSLESYDELGENTLPKSEISHFIQKPVGNTELLELVREILYKKKPQRSLRVKNSPLLSNLSLKLRKSTSSSSNLVKDNILKLHY